MPPHTAKPTPIVMLPNTVMARPMFCHPILTCRRIQLRRCTLSMNRDSTIPPETINPLPVAIPPDTIIPLHVAMLPGTAVPPCNARPLDKIFCLRAASKVAAALPLQLQPRRR